MIHVDIPGFGRLDLKNLVLDFNGTLAMDGRLIPGCMQRLTSITQQIDVFVLTADVYGSVRDELAGVNLEIQTLGSRPEDEAKRSFVAELGADQTVYIGNGRNDRLAIADAALGLAVIQAEGASPATVAAADVVLPDIHTALDLLTKHTRLAATLRA